MARLAMLLLLLLLTSGVVAMDKHGKARRAGGILKRF
jgi:hypothetical protein